MRVDQLITSLSAIHVARNAYRRPTPPSGHVRGDSVSRPRSRTSQDRVWLGAGNGGGGLMAGTAPTAPSTQGAMRSAFLAAGRSVRSAPQGMGRAPNMTPNQALLAPQASATRAFSHPPRRTRRKPLVRHSDKQGKRAELGMWLRKMENPHIVDAAPAPPGKSACNTAQPSPSASSPSYQAVRDALVGARMRKQGENVNRDRAARQVDFARAQQAWICGGETDADQRQLAWISIPEGTRVILRNMQQLFSVWSPGASATEAQRNASIDAILGGQGVSALTADQICRFEWVRGARALARRSQARLVLGTPLDCLLAVYRLNGTPFSRAIDPNQTLQKDIDAERLEAARLLYEQSRDPYFVPDYSAGLVAAQHAFRHALDDDLAERRLANGVIPMGAPTYRFTALWFDGMAVRGALGKSVGQIASDMHAGGMSLARAGRLVARRFRDLHESTDYVIGTPHHSLATILLRLGPLAGIPIDGIGDVGCLVERFKALEDRLMASGIYPLSPILLAARHCARSCGVVESSVQGEQEMLVDEVRTLLLAGSQEWRTQPFGPNPALSFDWTALASMARGKHVLTGSPFEQNAIALYKDLWVSREIIIESTEAALNRALLAWFGDRLLAYEPIPVFDEAQQAFDLIATTFAMSKATIEAPRYYIYQTRVGNGGVPRMMPVMRTGSWVQEFLDRRRYAIASDNKIQHRGNTIDTRLDLDRARQAFDLGLAHTKQVQAKAREVLRMKQQLLALPNVDSVAAGIAGTAQAKATLTQDSSLAVIFARGMKILGVFTPVEMIVNTIASGDPERIVDLLPFLGSSYQIEQGMWHNNWRQAGMGVVRLSADALFVWVQGLAEQEIVASLTASLKEVRRLPFEPPAMSMLKDFQGRSNVKTYAALRLETDGYSDVGEARGFEFRYREPGAGLPNEGRVSPAVPEQFGDRPPSAESLNQRRTVEDCKSLLEDMRRSASRVALPQDGAGCSWRDCLPFGGPRREPTDIGDLFVSEVPRLTEMIGAIGESFGRAPFFQRLAAYARSTQGMFRWRVMDGGRNAPVTLLSQGIIYLPEDSAITSRSYVGTCSECGFDLQHAGLHEFGHAMTLRRDNAGPTPWQERGFLIPLTEQIYYESNIPLAQRSVYQRYIPAAESPGRHAQASAAYPSARLDSLIENVELDGLFAQWNRDWPNYTILGTLAEDRVTVAEAPKVFAHLLATLSERPRDYPTAYRFDERVRVIGPEGFDIATVKDTLMENFNDLIGQHHLFAAIADDWLAKTDGEVWKFAFEVDDFAANPLRAWRVDREARIVYFNSRPLFHLSRGGPQVLTYLRILGGVILDLRYGPGLASPPLDVSFNRGSRILLENLAFGESGRIEQRVSAELSNIAAELWPKLGYACKAASDEDVRLEFLAARLEPKTIQNMDELGEYWMP
jgi:hypothetical protein